MSNNAHELSNRLLNALDNNYNVVDMHTVNEIISILEKINITKELLETTRLGKHVNELRRKTTDPTLARRAKVLVKRWRDLVIPNKASPAHTGSNRSSAERQVRRLGGTPLTSPALSRVFSPALVSPRPPSRPAWGGYESDSQDVILVDDDTPPAPPAPPAPPPAHAPPNTLATASPAKRPISPAPVQEEKKSKRDKKPKKRRGHSRAGAGTETKTAEPASSTVPIANSGSVSASTGSVTANTGSDAANTGSDAANTGSVAANTGSAVTSTGTAWGNRNGAHEPRERHERRRNGCRDSVDSYAALVNKIPQAGAKKVKTTKELLEQIQSRGAKLTSPGTNDADDDVVLVEDEVAPVKVESPLRNGESEEAALETKDEVETRVVSPFLPLEDETEYIECTCGDTPDESCAAAFSRTIRPLAVHALHHGLLAGINGTRAKPHPHRFAVRPPQHPDHPELFNSVVPLYKYSDYADDYCVKNLSRVPLCEHLPWTEFAPPPAELPPPASPPPLRPYPISDATLTEEANAAEVKMEVDDVDDTAPRLAYDTKIGPEPVSLPHLEPSDRLKPPILSKEDERHIGGPPPKLHSHLAPADHRTVPRTKPELKPELEPDGIPVKSEEFNGTVLRDACAKALASAPYVYDQADSATEVKPRDLHQMNEEELSAALVPETDERDELGRPTRPRRFAEWHECATLGDLIALPYVVID